MTVSAITGAVKLRVYLDIDAVACGGGSVMMGGLNANDPAQGQSQYPIVAGNAQTKRMQCAELVLGYNGSVTEAQLLTALQTIASDFAAASGSPLITTAIRTEINGWATGNP